MFYGGCALASCTFGIQNVNHSWAGLFLPKTNHNCCQKIEQRYIWGFTEQNPLIEIRSCRLIHIFKIFKSEKIFMKKVHEYSLSKTICWISLFIQVVTLSQISVSLFLKLVSVGTIYICLCLWRYIGVIFPLKDKCVFIFSDEYPSDKRDNFCKNILTSFLLIHNY